MGNALVCVERDWWSAAVDESRSLLSMLWKLSTLSELETASASPVLMSTRESQHHQHNH